MELGERGLIGNPENLMDLRIVEVLDVYEFSESEFYFEISEKPVIEGSLIELR